VHPFDVGHPAAEETLFTPGADHLADEELVGRQVDSLDQPALQRQRALADHWRLLKLAEKRGEEGRFVAMRPRHQTGKVGFLQQVATGETDAELPVGADPLAGVVPLAECHAEIERAVVDRCDPRRRQPVRLAVDHGADQGHRHRIEKNRRGEADLVHMRVPPQKLECLGHQGTDSF
jgi:hypothetical protein